MRSKLLPCLFACAFGSESRKAATNALDRKSFRVELSQGALIAHRQSVVGVCDMKELQELALLMRRLGFRLDLEVRRERMG